MRWFRNQTMLVQEPDCIDMAFLQVSIFYAGINSLFLRNKQLRSFLYSQQGILPQIGMRWLILLKLRQDLLCMYMYIHAHIHTHTHSHTHTCTHTYIHTYIQTYIHVHTCIYIRTYIYTIGLDIVFGSSIKRCIN